MRRRTQRELLFDEEFLRRLRHLAMAGRRILTSASGGRHRATDLGDGLEFADHRDYSPGDELRYVDWNIFGRLDRLQIRLFHRHSEQQIHLLLDCSGSMGIGTPAKDVFARRCAAGLAYLARSNLDHVTLSAWGGEGAARDGESARREMAPRRGRSQSFSAILDFLAGLEMGGPMRLAEWARRWQSRTRGRGLAILLSDCAELVDLTAAIRRIRHAGQQVAVLQIYAPADTGRVPPGPLALADPEHGGPPLRLSGQADLTEAYRRQFDRHLAHVRAAVHSVGGVHAHTASDGSWEKFLLAALRRLRMAAV